MARLELVLVDWPERGLEGPRLLGRLADPDLLAQAQDRLAADHLRQLADLRPPVRPAPGPDEGTA